MAHSAIVLAHAAFERWHYFVEDGEIPEGYPEDISEDELRYQLDIYNAHLWAYSQEVRRLQAAYAPAPCVVCAARAA